MSETSKTRESALKNFTLRILFFLKGGKKKLLQVLKNVPKSLLLPLQLCK